MNKSVRLIASTLIAASALLAPVMEIHADSSPTITEFPIPAGGYVPYGITTGPDGALWYTEYAGNNIARITTSGSITEYPIPTQNANARDITVGPDGALWFTEEGSNKIGRITTEGVITEFDLPATNENYSPYDIVTGPDGALWFTEFDSEQIGRITTAGAVTEFDVGSNSPTGIAVGPDGALWFGEYSGEFGAGGNHIGRITMSGAITQYSIPTADSYPIGIAEGSDGAMWFTELLGQKIGRITTAGAITEFPIASTQPYPVAITSGPDGALWFTEQNGNNVGRITTAGDISEYPIPSAYSEPSHITTGPDGNLWFTEEEGHVGRVNLSSPAPVLDQAIAAGGSGSGDFAADTDFSGGTTYSSSAAVDTSQVNNPGPQSVYQSARYGDNFNYTIPNLTPGASYTAQLDFNELYWGTPTVNGGVGSRVFNVAVSGGATLNNFDIFDAAGGANKAIAEQLPAVADADGNITITFTSVKDHAMVNGIEIYSGTVPAEPKAPTVSNAYIAAGGAAVGDFSADTGFGGGSTYTTSATVGTSGDGVTAPESVFQSCRYGDFTYNIPNLAPGSYNVKLDFSEPVFNTVGSRVFDVSINGQAVPLLTNFDVVAQTGGENIAYSTSGITATPDANGNISIAFTSVTNNAMVSGIEITPVSGQ